jgi:hypothetical protein
MKKSVVLVLLVTFVGFLYSFKTPDNVVYVQNTFVSQSDTLIDSLSDTVNLYNCYRVHYKKMGPQIITIPSEFDIYKFANKSGKDLRKFGRITNIDTLSVNVPE